MDKDRRKIDGKSITRMFINDDEDETSNRWKRSKVDTESTGERSKVTTESMADLLSDDEAEPLAPPQLLSPSQSSLFELSGTEHLLTAPSSSIQPSTMTPTQLLPLPQSSFCESSGTELLPTTASSSTQPPTMMTIQPPTTQLSEEENMETLLKNLASQTVKEDGMASKRGVKECVDEVAKDMAYRILDEECDAFVRDVTTLPPSTQPDLELSDDEKPNMENIAKKG